MFHTKTFTTQAINRPFLGNRIKKIEQELLGVEQMGRNNKLVSTAW
jgi:hypothetical protein